MPRQKSVGIEPEGELFLLTFLFIRTIRIDKYEAAKTEWDETEIPVNWPAALFVRSELVASA
jgi:hypothetical protein